MTNELVEDGHYVVLMKSFDSGNMKIVQATKQSIVHYGKLHFDPSPLIGCRYGSVFEIKDNLMKQVENFHAYDLELSNLVSEKLQNFDGKSQFSQEKIIKKKKKQNHANIVTVIRPSLLLINEMLFARDKLGGLRLDALSQILTFANIQNGSKTLLLDHNLGLMTSAVVSRSLPDGICIQIVPDNEAIYTTRKTLSMLNIDPEIYKDKLLGATIRDFFKILRGTSSFASDMAILSERMTRVPSSTDDQHMDHSNSIDQSLDEKELTLMRKNANRETRFKEKIRISELLTSSYLDSLILIAQHDHPLPLLRLAYPLLAPSRNFVIYSDAAEPLLECYEYLKTNSLAVSLSLSESWLRKYQVLPERTRPEMSMSGYGGYLLSGIKALFGPPA